MDDYIVVSRQLDGKPMYIMKNHIVGITEESENATEIAVTGGEPYLVKESPKEVLYRINEKGRYKI